MIVSRQGETFDVVDFPDWFWDAWDKFEPESFDAIDAFLSPGKTFVDIGAWIGPLSLWAARKGAHVISVEPDPIARTVLEENVRLNGFGDQIQVVALAVSDTTGTGHLAPQGHKDDPGEFGNSMSHLADTGELVPTTTIADLWAMCQIDNVGLVKIDIEGGEARLVADAPFLRQWPLLFSSHGPWMSRDDQAAVSAAFGCDTKNFGQVMLDAIPTGSH